MGAEVEVRKFDPRDVERYVEACITKDSGIPQIQTMPMDLPKPYRQVVIAKCANVEVGRDTVKTVFYYDVPDEWLEIIRANRPAYMIFYKGEWQDIAKLFGSSGK